LIGGDGVPKVLHARIGGGCVWQWLVVEAGLAGEQSNQGVGGLNVFKGHAQTSAQASGVKAKSKGPK